MPLKTFAIATTALVVFTIAALRSPIAQAQDQTGCDATTITGGYGFNLKGFVYDSRGNSYLLASIGRLEADGNGALNGTDTFSFDGTIVKRKMTGTYTINSDCTGSASLQNSDNSTAHLDLVVVNNGKEINVIQTDPGFIFSGVLKRQNQ
jgi:hypothetical protein